MRPVPRPTTSWLVALLLLATGCASCDSNGSTPATAGGANASGPAAADHAAAQRPPAAPSSKVIETMNAGGYTYVALEVDGQQTWYAGPETPIAVGDTVRIPERSLPMHNFESGVLGRTFDLIYFVQLIQKVGPPIAIEDAVQQAHQSARPRAGSADPSTGAAAPSTGAAPSGVDLTGIAKADGGVTVAEIFAGGKDGAGQDLVLRGRVVKYNAGILGKNWLHVRDGSGAEGADDIVVTTADVAAVGDLVLVRGKLAADRDLGFGYKFDLLIEDAKVTVE